jgi:trehalose/maltose hydrolase-like predicted phosphorylase
MRRFGLALVAAGVLLGATSGVAAASTGSFLLTAHSPTGSRYAPTFTGNGFLGVRVPVAGEGYASGNVPAQSELAGFYAKPTHPASPSQAVQQRANIPTWSTLLFGDGTDTYGTGGGTLTGWSQSLDLHTGIVTTSGTWHAADGHSATFSYQVFTDRANAHAAVVSLKFTPHWSGTATVTDEIDGTPANLSDQVGKGFNAALREIWVEVATQTTGIDAAISSRLTSSPSVSGTPTEVDQSQDQSIGQQLSFPVSSGSTYTFTKFVGVDNSQDSANPVAAAQGEAARGSASGAASLRSANDRSWSGMWQGRIDVLGNRTLATDVNASEFYLWSNTRDGVNWSISPAGLSSNGYDGHIFWDAETWMYPSLLAEHPDLAAGMNNYRFARLGAAKQHATATGYQGARFPWESALDGTEQIPPPPSINSEGLYEMHITADIALAQWQYYLVTGNRSWLRKRGWPVLSGAATFWASKATRGADGRYHINHVTGPDEENPDVNDEVYTLVAAKTTLQNAVKAARALGKSAPASWSTIARRLAIHTSRVSGVRIYKEFSGYRSQMVKQADVTMLQYPWRYPMTPRVAQNDLNFYVPRSDPGGPSMDDAVSSIDTSALGSPGCASYVYTERSYLPFIRDVFNQFSETRYGGAFTFMTGIGGFLQEFLYGYSGLRWGSSQVSLAPSLTKQLAGVVLHNVRWRGRVFTVSVGRRHTTVTLTSGAPMRVSTPAGVRTVRQSQTLRLRTARPDLKRTSDLVRCQSTHASSSELGAVPLAAVDGSPATDWQPVKLPAAFTTRVSGNHRRISHATVRWGHLWPLVTAPNVPPAPGPVKTVRASDYKVQVSTNDQTWRTVAQVSGVTQRAVDHLRFRSVHARWVRLVLTKSSQPPIPPTTQDQNPPPTTPMLEELSVTR